MGVEVNGYGEVGLEFGDDRGGTRRSHEAGHILEGDDFCTEAFHFAGFLYEIFVGENLFGFCGLAAEEACKETFLLSRSFGFGVNGVAYGAVGYAAEIIDHAD